MNSRLSRTQGWPMNPKSGAGPTACAPDTLNFTAQNPISPFILSGSPGKSLELAGEERMESENRGQVTRLGNEWPGHKLCEENKKIIDQTSQLETRPILSLPNAHSLGPGSLQSPTEVSLLPANLPFNNHPGAPTTCLAGRQVTHWSGSLSPVQTEPLQPCGRGQGSEHHRP